MIVGGTAFWARAATTGTPCWAPSLLTVLTTILVGHGYDTADQQIIFGVLILLVVAGYGRDRTTSDEAAAVFRPQKPCARATPSRRRST